MIFIKCGGCWTVHTWRRLQCQECFPCTTEGDLAISQPQCPKGYLYACHPTLTLELLQLVCTFAIQGRSGDWVCIHHAFSAVWCITITRFVWGFLCYLLQLFMRCSNSNHNLHCCRPHYGSYEWMHHLLNSCEKSFFSRARCTVLMSGKIHPNQNVGNIRFTVKNVGLKWTFHNLCFPTQTSSVWWWCIVSLSHFWQRSNVIAPVFINE